jgi:hypothetical protein
MRPGRVQRGRDHQRRVRPILALELYPQTFASPYKKPLRNRPSKFRENGGFAAIENSHTKTIDFRRDGISADGVLMRPLFQAAALTAAREELSKAIAIIERTKWERTE